MTLLNYVSNLNITLHRLVSQGDILKKFKIYIKGFDELSCWLKLTRNFENKYRSKIREKKHPLRHHLTFVTFVDFSKISYKAKES